MDDVLAASSKRRTVSLAGLAPVTESTFSPLLKMMKVGIARTALGRVANDQEGNRDEEELGRKTDHSAAISSCSSTSTAKGQGQAGLDKSCSWRGRPGRTLVEADVGVGRLKLREMRRDHLECDEERVD